MVRDAARAYLGDEDVVTIEQVELRRLLGAREAVALDVRPADEYRSGHIPRALSIPAEELAERLGEIPQALRVVVYGRGAYCLPSHEAVRLLSARGRDAVRLAGGVVGWRQSGRPLVSGLR
jgi:rhodanese-related sulfurtransferase